MTPQAQGLLDLAALVLKFAKVNRVTMHEDGKRFESDTDHTVMLSLCACALSDALYKDILDIGKVAQFALVHDLVEVHVGDTNTVNISLEDREEKERKELDSLKKIEKEFGEVYPWIHTTIQSYEKRDTKEARFVKVLDKVMTKLTNTLNKGAAVRSLGTSREEITHHFAVQTEEYKRKYAEEFPELIALLEESMKTMLQEMYV